MENKSLSHAQCHLQAIQDAFASGILGGDTQQAILTQLLGTEFIAADRLAIYRGNLRAIWSKALENAFPVISELVGKEFFEMLARDYGRQFPSTSGDLNAFGQYFSHFLQQSPAVFDYPYFVDVAALEWQVHRAYYAANEKTLALDTFLAVLGGHAQDACLSMPPACSLYQSQFASVDIWLAHQREVVTGLNVPLQTPSYALITRDHWQVEVLSLDLSSFLALDALSKGETLSQALELALLKDATFDVAKQLAMWFEAGAFSSYYCKELGSDSTKS